MKSNNLFLELRRIYVFEDIRGWRRELAPSIISAADAHISRQRELHPALIRGPRYCLQDGLPIVPVRVSLRRQVEVTVHHNLEVIPLVLAPVGSERPAARDEGRAGPSYLRLDLCARGGYQVDVVVREPERLPHLAHADSGEVLHSEAEDLRVGYADRDLVSACRVVLKRRGGFITAASLATDENADIFLIGSYARTRPNTGLYKLRAPYDPSPPTHL